MLSLDWTFLLLLFFFLIQVRFFYMPVTKAIRSSSALQQRQHAVLSVQRDHRLKRCFSEHLPERVGLDGGFMSHGLNAVSEAFPPQQRKKRIYPGGNTGLKC